MYCYKCGIKLDEEAVECVQCGISVAHVIRPNYYKMSMVLAILAVVLPFFGFGVKFIEPIIPFIAIILLLISLFFALKSGRKSAFAINIAGIALWLMFIITPFLDIDVKPGQSERIRESVDVEEGRVVQNN